jgi:hypothetical protein
MELKFNRRRIGLVIAAFASAAPLMARAAESEDGVAVTPPEDLMREHGVLNRILLIYEAVMRKFDAKEGFDASVIGQAA